SGRGETGQPSFPRPRHLDRRTAVPNSWPSQNRPNAFQSGRARSRRRTDACSRPRIGPGMAAHLTPDAPAVRLELRHGGARPVVYDVAGGEFLIGSVPGCDLRLSGPNLPPVVCVVSRHADAVRLRKLAPALPLLLNGQPVTTADLQPGDTVTLGNLALVVHIDAPAA